MNSMQKGTLTGKKWMQLTKFYCQPKVQSDVLHHNDYRYATFTQYSFPETQHIPIYVTLPWTIIAFWAEKVHFV